MRLSAGPLAGLPSDSPLRRLTPPPPGESVPGRAAAAGRGPLLDGRTAAVSASVLAAVPAVGWLTWWRKEEKASFHVEREGWFGRGTYTGGADKASHFVMAAALQEGAESIYLSLGKDERQARLLGLVLVSLGGVVIEAGDGLTKYGASWEDAAMNVLGAATTAGISEAGWNDTVGFRAGLVKSRIPDPCCRATAYGGDYTKWVHSADVKLKGLLPRIGVEPGPARFLLVSFTYGTKGYRFSPVDVRERNVGIDVGLNVEEILRAVGVPEDRWWGRPLLVFARYFRVPWTAFGWRYDLNSRKWRGPDTGDVFDPGAVIYD